MNVSPSSRHAGAGHQKPASSASAQPAHAVSRRVLASQSNAAARAADGPPQARLTERSPRSAWPWARSKESAMEKSEARTRAAIGCLIDELAKPPVHHSADRVQRAFTELETAMGPMLKASGQDYDSALRQQVRAYLTAYVKAQRNDARKPLHDCLESLRSNVPPGLRACPILEDELGRSTGSDALRELQDLADCKGPRLALATQLGKAGKAVREHRESFERGAACEQANAVVKGRAKAVGEQLIPIVSASPEDVDALLGAVIDLGIDSAQGPIALTWVKPVECSTAELERFDSGVRGFLPIPGVKEELARRSRARPHLLRACVALCDETVATATRQLRILQNLEARLTSGDDIETVHMAIRAEIAKRRFMEFRPRPDERLDAEVKGVSTDGLAKALSLHSVREIRNLIKDELDWPREQLNDFSASAFAPALKEMRAAMSAYGGPLPKEMFAENMANMHSENSRAIHRALSSSEGIMLPAGLWRTGMRLQKTHAGFGKHLVMMSEQLRDLRHAAEGTLHIRRAPENRNHEDAMKSPEFFRTLREAYGIEYWGHPVVVDGRASDKLQSQLHEHVAALTSAVPKGADAQQAALLLLQGHEFDPILAAMHTADSPVISTEGLAGSLVGGKEISFHQKRQAAGGELRVTFTYQVESAKQFEAHNMKIPVKDAAVDASLQLSYEVSISPGGEVKVSAPLSVQLRLESRGDAELTQAELEEAAAERQAAVEKAAAERQVMAVAAAKEREDKGWSTRNLS
jgi:hypothetical protein